MMLDGFGYVVGHALLLLVAVALGVVLGRYAWPHRRHRQDAPSAAAVLGSRVSEGRARPGSLPAAGGDAPAGGPVRATSPMPATSAPPIGTFPMGTAREAAVVADFQARAAYSEARAAYSDVRLDQAQARLVELEARLNESQWALQETRRQLGQAHAEVIRLWRNVQELADRKEAEMGRLESGAIAALESTIAAHREQVAKLQEKLRAAETAAEEHVQELVVERRRSDQLRAALSERYEHIATLMSERQQQERASARDSGVGR
jgi:hypothetical protein